MALKPLVLFIAISLGGGLGWFFGRPGGLLGSYFTGVLGSALGLYIGRKIQRRLDGE